MKAKIKKTGRIFTVISIERKVSGAMYDLRITSGVIKPFTEDEIEIVEY